MASLDKVNFSVRPNKNVERKLIFEALRSLDPPFSFRDYRYIGLGGIWFTDFILAHRILHIDKMDSMETRADWAERARFNRPFSSVQVSAGKSTDVLAGLALSSQAAVVWMDYDTDITGPVLLDVPILADQLPPGSVILITLNVDPRLLGREFEERATRLSQAAAGYYTEPIGLDFFDAVHTAFPANIARILFARLKRDISQRFGLEFIELFNFYYADNAPMVTVGGIVVDGSSRSKLQATGVWSEAGVSGDKQFPIRLPILTRREKLYLDRLLPRAPSLDLPFLIEHQKGKATERKERLMLDESELRAYNDFYRYYPLYSEAET